MPIDCRDAVLEVSNYIDGDIDSSLRLKLEAHFAECPKCAALLASLRNVIRLYGDERLFPLPEGFSARLNQRLSAAAGERRAIPFPSPADVPPRRSARARTWWATAIAAGLIAALLVASEARPGRLPVLMSKHSEPARRVPESLVVITDDGKTFHVPGCKYIHGRQRTVTAAEAIREGYAPCVRCEHALLVGMRQGARPINSRMASRTRGNAAERGSTGSKWSAPAISTSLASSPKARARST